MKANWSSKVSADSDVSVVIETTRRCNMRCAHCLRGDAQEKDMPVRTARAAAMAFNFASRVHVGGGESTLTPPRLIRAIGAWFDICLLTMISNGTPAPKGFAAALREMSCDVDVSISNDNMHRFVDVDEAKDALKHDGGKYLTVERAYLKKMYGWSTETLAMGRASGWGKARAVAHAYDAETKDGEVVFKDGMFYVDVYGNVWPSCDLSYAFMSKCRNVAAYSLGNVHDKKFDATRAAMAFNAKFAGRFPLGFSERGVKYRQSKGTLKYDSDSAAMRIARDVMRDAYGESISKTNFK